MPVKSSVSGKFTKSRDPATTFRTTNYKHLLVRLAVAGLPPAYWDGNPNCLEWPTDEKLAIGLASRAEAGRLVTYLRGWSTNNKTPIEPKRVKA